MSNISLAATTNIRVRHAGTGVLRVEVIRTRRISPGFMRVTIGGADLRRYEYQGFDQWFRLALPIDDATRFDNLPQRFGVGGYVKYLSLPKDTRPVIRNYTVRAFRPEIPELDIDFVVHGDEGIAGPWALGATAGTRVAFVDQGVGWKPRGGKPCLLVADETGLPAVAGILRDLPRDTRGSAIIEVPDVADLQETGAPPGVMVHWVTRTHGRPGELALAAARDLTLDADTSVFAVGEAQLATGVRRYAVEQGVHKADIVFCGYWRMGR